jgi:hypothetical protein
MVARTSFVLLLIAAASLACASAAAAPEGARVHACARPTAKLVRVLQFAKAPASTCMLFDRQGTGSHPRTPSTPLTHAGLESSWLQDLLHRSATSAGAKVADYYKSECESVLGLKFTETARSNCARTGANISPAFWDYGFTSSLSRAQPKHAYGDSSQLSINTMGVEGAACDTTLDFW